ncbi:hypothetical protein BDN72DRAFT_113762 [Pluteus cervinus]|uniref:Uncharacterized protein n=1 Tax=Pluteus cervinus TaxID=181527 RepID=A0ACD3AMI4_9AGAR|nr:hypothetical protein BDN72DRAFT_113762 [Pluteus cervinus]
MAPSAQRRGSITHNKVYSVFSTGLDSPVTRGLSLVVKLYLFFDASMQFCGSSTLGSCSSCQCHDAPGSDDQFVICNRNFNRNRGTRTESTRQHSSQRTYGLKACPSRGIRHSRALNRGPTVTLFFSRVSPTQNPPPTQRPGRASSIDSPLSLINLSRGVSSHSPGACGHASFLIGDVVLRLGSPSERSFRRLNRNSLYLLRD